LVDDDAMEAETRKIMARLNPNFQKFSAPVSALSGGQRQSVAITRAVYFNARILIMDEPTAALGPQETEMVAELIQQLKAEGIGIFLISHDYSGEKPQSGVIRPVLADWGRAARALPSARIFGRIRKGLC
jgi:ABC-type sugar transport system ATPase subunit